MFPFFSYCYNVEIFYRGAEKIYMRRIWQGENFATHLRYEFLHNISPIYYGLDGIGHSRSKDSGDQ